jgi:murein DD-endopeptidase MepM/ murein hydrolase activator NlpD
MIKQALFPSQITRPHKDSLLRRSHRVELVLAAFLMICVLVPLSFRIPELRIFEMNPIASGSRSRLHLPADSEVERAMVQYLIPDELNRSQENNLSPSVIRSLSITSYRVKRGDTLSEIAQKYKLTLDTIISYNNIRDARAMKSGMVLQLPNSNGLKYRVRRGDYLGGIAKKFGVSLNNLLDWNSLSSSVIQPGQELFIPNARLGEMELNRVLGKLFIYPTRGRVTSRFGERVDPFTGVKRFHNGVDIANAAGTTVVAAMSGRVAMLGFNPNFGKYLIVTHPEGFQTLYGHLDSFNVSKGQRVKQGQLIAKMGNTGYSTGSHLHFSVFKKGEPVDPFKFLH